MTRLDEILAGQWFTTRSGRKVHPWGTREMLESAIDIGDIAAALSKVCRFGGHTRWFYSVAQHSVLVSRNVPQKHALEALLHDASEAYLGDMMRPVKKGLAEYRMLEERFEWAIAAKFGLAGPHERPECVKEADMRALMTERRDLMNIIEVNPQWDIDEMGIVPFPDEIKCLRAHEAQAQFLGMYFKLREEREEMDKL